MPHLTKEITAQVAYQLLHFVPPDILAKYVSQPDHSLSLTFEDKDLRAIFESGQPDCFEEGEGAMPYRGQDLAKRRILRHINGLKVGGRVKFFFTGAAGTGKTALARICAHLIQTQHLWLGLPEGGYYEVLPSQVSDKAKLDAFMQHISTNDPYATVFIDEAHTLEHIENLFHVLHDTGDPWYPMADGSTLPMPGTISWMAGTTDPGEADKTTGGALLRRLEPEISLEPLTRDDIAHIVTDMAAKDGLPIHAEAAYEVADRVMFPWEAKDLVYKEVRLIAEAEGTGQILPSHVQEALDDLQYDSNGLRRQDRDVIKALLLVNGGQGIRLVTKPGVVRYKMDEQSLCAVTGIDRATYGKRIKPKLMAKGYLIPVGGQCLTDEAVAEYEWLRGETY